MESERYLLEPENANKFVRILQVVFGIVCLLVAIVWLAMTITTLKSTLSIWVTIVFLAGFGYVQIISGLGKATRFIKYSQSDMTLKLHSFLPFRTINGSEIERIDIYPLSIQYLLRSGKKIVLRFGTTYPEITEPVKQATEEFSGANNIRVEYKTEEL